MRKVQDCSEDRKGLFQRVASPGDTGEILLKDLPPGCLKELDYTGGKSLVMETKGAGVVGATD